MDPTTDTPPYYGVPLSVPGVVDSVIMIAVPAASHAAAVAGSDQVKVWHRKGRVHDTVLDCYGYDMGLVRAIAGHSKCGTAEKPSCYVVAHGRGPVYQIVDHYALALAATRGLAPAPLCQAFPNLARAVAFITAVAATDQLPVLAPTGGGGSTGN